MAFIITHRTLEKFFLHFKWWKKAKEKEARKIINE